MPILFGHSLPFLEMNGGTTGTERLGELGKGNIPVNCLTEIFRGDNVIGMDYYTAHSPEYQSVPVMRNDRKWAHYQVLRDNQNKWGQHLSSSLDQNWDIKTCIERLDMLEKQIREGLSPPVHDTSAPSPAVDLGEAPGESWSTLAEEAHGALPKEVKIAYKTKDGKIQYASFVPASPSPCTPRHNKIRLSKHSMTMSKERRRQMMLELLR